MMHSFSYECCGTVLSVESEMVELFSCKDAFKHLVLISRDKHPSPAIRLVYRNRSTPYVHWDGNSLIEFHAPWNSVKDNEMLKTLLYSVTQRALQSEGKFMVHAVALSDLDRSHLFFGTAGSGKTTIGLYVCSRFGLQWISNGSAVLKVCDGKPMILGSVKKGIKLRLSSLSKSFPELVESIFPGLNSDNISSTFDAKISVSPQHLGLRFDTRNLPVAKLHKIKLDDTEFSVFPQDAYRLRLELYEDLSRFVRGSSTLLLYGKEQNQSIFLPSLDDDILHKSRLELIESIIQNCLGDTMHGTPDDCSKYFFSILRRTKGVDGTI